MSPLDQIAERVELLLARHAALQCNNALLAEQVAALSLERDSLRSRLHAARARIEELVDRLPACEPVPASATVAPDAALDALTASLASSSSPLPPKDRP